MEILQLQLLSVDNLDSQQKVNNIPHVSQCLYLHISDSAAYYFGHCFGYGIVHGLPVLLSTIECSSAELQLSQCNHIRSRGAFFFNNLELGAKQQEKVRITRRTIRYISAVYFTIICTAVPWCASESSNL